MTSLIADARHRSSPGVQHGNPTLSRERAFQASLRRPTRIAGRRCGRGIRGNPRRRYILLPDANRAHFHPRPPAPVVSREHRPRYPADAATGFVLRLRDPGEGSLRGGRRHPRPALPGQSLCARRTAHPLLRRGSAGHRGGSQPRQPLRHRPGTTRAAVRARHRHARAFRPPGDGPYPYAALDQLHRRANRPVQPSPPAGGRFPAPAARRRPHRDRRRPPAPRPAEYHHPYAGLSLFQRPHARGARPHPRGTAGFHPLQDQPDALRTAPATAATGRNRVGLPPLAAGLRKPRRMSRDPDQGHRGTRRTTACRRSPRRRPGLAAPGGQRGRRRPRPRCRLGPLQPAAGPGPAARLHIADLAVPGDRNRRRLPSGVSAENRPADRQVHGRGSAAALAAPATRLRQPRRIRAPGGKPH